MPINIALPGYPVQARQSKTHSLWHLVILSYQPLARFGSAHSSLERVRLKGCDAWLNLGSQQQKKFKRAKAACKDYYIRSAHDTSNNVWKRLVCLVCLEKIQTNRASILQDTKNRASMFGVFGLTVAEKYKLLLLLLHWAWVSCAR